MINQDYLTHSRPFGSKNGYHLFGKAQNPEKYVNGTNTIGLMDEWNKQARTAREATEWTDWAEREGYIDPNRFRGKENAYRRNVATVGHERYRRAMAAREADNIRVAAGMQNLGKLYNTPLGRLHDIYFVAGSKVRAAGGLKKMISDFGNKIVTNVSSAAKRFTNFITGRTAAAKQANQLAQQRGASQTNYYKNQQAQSRARAATTAAQQRGASQTDYYKNMLRKQRSRDYVTNSKWMPTAVY